MNIKKLGMNNFGKFHNKEILFKDGINIVYGENEKGKSTVHKFIEGVFFGFFKPYRKNKQYTVDYKKYLPWRGPFYDGTLVYEKSGYSYRIERNFFKSKDAVAFYDDLNGEDLSKSLNYDEKIRLYEPYSLHLGLNLVVYKNTISISQLKHKTESDLIKEVKESLVNFGDSQDEKISVVQILNRLGEKSDKIGTVKAKNKLLGQKILKLVNLESELDTSLKANKEILESCHEMSGLEKEIEADEAGMVEKQKILLGAEAKRLAGKFEQATNQKKIMEELNKKLMDLNGYKDVSDEDEAALRALREAYNNLEFQLVRDQETIEKIKQSKLELSKKLEHEAYIEKERKILSEINGIYEKFIGATKNLKRYDDQIEKIKKEISKGKKGKLSIIEKDYKEFLSLENRLAEQDGDRSEAIRILSKKLVENKLKSKKIKRILLLMFLFSVVSLGIGLGFRKIGMVVVSGIGGIGIVIECLLIRRNKIKADQLVYEGLILGKKQENKNKDFEDIEKKITLILKNYGCEHKFDLQKLYSREKGNDDYALKIQREVEILEKEKNLKLVEVKEYELILKSVGKNLFDDEIIDQEVIKKMQNCFNGYIENQAKHVLLEETLETKQKEYEVVKQEYEIKKFKYEHLLKKNKADSFEAYEQFLKLKSEYEFKLSEVKYAGNILDEILGGLSYDQLSEKVSEKDCLSEINDSEYLDEIRTELEAKKALIEKNKHVIGKVEERILMIEKNNRPVNLVEADIEEVKRQIDHLMKNKKALDLAMTTIEKLSKDIQRDFAPRLNEQISDMMAHVTQGKYKEIKVDSELNVRVLEGDLDKLVDLECLSTGTIDQIYLAMRLAVVETIGDNEKLPLILDDCFVNFDDKRLNQTLAYLTDLSKSKKRQIIILTCQKREQEILDRLNEKYHLVEL